MGQKKIASICFFMSMIFAVAMTDTTAAQPGAYPNYVRLGIGVNQPTDDLDSSGYDTGLFTGVVYGRYLTRNLVFEGGLQNFFAEQDFHASTSYGPYIREDQLSATALTATLKGELPVGAVVIYAGGGLGGYFVNLDSDIDTYYGGSFDVDDDDTVFGVHVVAGVYYNLMERLFVGAEGMYRWTGDVDIEEDVFTIPVRYKGNLDGFVGAAIVGFRF